MLERLLAFITSHKLISTKDTILAAVSGGLDSMVMLFCLKNLVKELDIDLKVVHVNHGIRGAESDADEELVSRQCKSLKLPFYSRRLTGFEIDSSEEKLRNARYAEFAGRLEQFPGSKIATAHHLDDQLETFLMRLAKGSGTKGLLGIPVKRDRFIRPMLFAGRAELADYAAENNIPFNEDSTNQDYRRLRNHIRHEIVPKLIEVFGRPFYQGYEKSAADLNAVYEGFKELSSSLFEKNIKFSSSSAEFKIDFYQALRARLKHEMLKYCISSLIPLNSTISVSLFQEFDSFAAASETGSVFFIQGIKVSKKRSTLLFSAESDCGLNEAELHPGQKTVFGDFIISLYPLNCKDIKFNQNADEEFISSDQFKFPLKIRSWKEGDFFYPLGLGKKQKLSDFFINKKIERPEKKKMPVVCSGEEIVWLAGLRLDERYKVRRDGTDCYRLKLQKKGSE